MGDVSDGKGLEDFYTFLWEGLEGYAYLFTKEIVDGEPKFKRHFFKWPERQADVVQFTVLNRAKREVYCAPAIFITDENAEKTNVKAANVAWADFDEKPPTSYNAPSPTCRIASGGEHHEHWYWRLEAPANGAQLDLINEALAYALGADHGTWNCNRVLRPPETFNHKRKRQVTLIDKQDVKLNLSLFASVPKPPPTTDSEAPQYIPPFQTVYGKYAWTKQAMDLLAIAEPADRSDALMTLGYCCAEMGLTPAEIYSVILFADDRWGKFKGRTDRARRIQEIVTIAIKKYPEKAKAKTKPVELVDWKPYGFMSLLRTEIKLEWVWDGFLQRNGYYLLTGPSGVGKTQFSLDAAGHMALGKPFLGKKMEQAKVGFISLEMPIPDLKYFLTQLQYAFAPKEHEVMEEQLKFFPIGEAVDMSDDEIRDVMDQLVGDLKLDVVMIDSLSAATTANLNDDSVRSFFDWMDSFRQRHKVATWVIHHHRKSSGDNRKPKKLDDVYGNGVIVRRATTVACMWDPGLPNIIEYIPLKTRLAPKQQFFHLQRDERLHFVKVVTAGSNPLALGSPQPSPNGGSAPAGPAIGQGPATGHQAAVTGAWSIGPTDYPAALPEPAEKEKNQADEVEFDLDFGGIS